MEIQMTDDLRTMLDLHIPYRLAAIDGLRWVCELLLSDREPGRVEVTFDSAPILTSTSYRFLTNPMLEMGAIYCRVLLEFFGIGLAPGGHDLEFGRERKNKDDDVGIEQFGLPQLMLGDIRKAAPGAEDQAGRSCVVTIQIAHKAVAHLTKGRQPDFDLERLYLCSELVPRLVLKHLYLPLGQPEPRYKLATAG